MPFVELNGENVGGRKPLRRSPDSGNVSHGLPKSGTP
ncbi:LPS-assembly lptD domain protein [Burkholderia thailandensis USAMRU Malaysia |nr:LPS-assembly lptD domain protein [Burkholderia thailandensis USAMRU Malaysia \